METTIQRIIKLTIVKTILDTLKQKLLKIPNMAYKRLHLTIIVKKMSASNNFVVASRLTFVIDKQQSHIVKSYQTNTLLSDFMPVPKPESNESERDYISRCEKFMHEENYGKPKDERRSNKQLTAICYSTWRENKK